jgi:hypothetical protein
MMTAPANSPKKFVLTSSGRTVGDLVTEPNVSDFSPGKNSNYSLDDYVGQISQNWQRGVEAFMATAVLCADADMVLQLEDRDELLKKLPFGASAYSKFVQIGRDPRLRRPEVRQLLPPHYTTTYEVTSLTDQEFEAALAEKVIRPDVTRKELLSWRSSRRRRPKSHRPSLSSHATATTATISREPMVATTDKLLAVASRPPFIDAGNLDIQPSLEPQKIDEAFARLKAVWLAAPSVARTRFITEVVGIAVSASGWGSWGSQPNSQRD